MGEDRATRPVRQTPAPAEEYLERGFSERARIGNAAADASAGSASAARLPPEAIVAARVQQVSQLWQVQRLLAFTELAALKANHQRFDNGQPRVNRRWADVRRGAQVATRRAAAAPRVASQSAACRELALPQPAGPPPPPLHALTRDGETLQCRQCGKTASRARWSDLAYGHCTANGGLPGAEAPPGVYWQRVPHRIVEADGLVRCARCRGSVPAHRRATFVTRRCPAWWLASPNGDVAAPGDDHQQAAICPAAPMVTPAADGSDWGAWVFAVLGHAVAGTSGSRVRTAGSHCEGVPRPMPAVVS